MMKETGQKKGGRNPKTDLKSHCVMVRFNDAEWMRFLAMFEQSDMRAKAVFIKKQFFNQPFKVLRIDKTFVDYYTKLSDFHAQFRAIGTNYNQVIKILNSHFSEKKTKALLYKLEQHTVELVKLSHRITGLSSELKERNQSEECAIKTETAWSQKSV